MRVAAIIAAGGKGARLGGDRPKQLLDIGGRTILEHSVGAFLRSSRVDELVVVLPRELASRPIEALVRLDVGKPLRVVAGGPRRQDSVARGFDAVGPESDVIVVHDAARPFVSEALIARTIDAAARFGAAVAALPASDTVKQAAPDAHAGEELPVVQSTLPRDTIYLAQTPQAFQRRVLADAIALGRRGVEATDEAWLAERAGHTVRLVPGDRQNVKITTAEDLDVARASRLGPGGLRIGLGYDLHRLAAGRPLWLGGVRLPHPRGLMGHSDADAVCHALTDAILGAAAAGDIGQHFPDTDPAWKDASSVDLLKRAMRLVRSKGYQLVNVDIVVLAEQPVLAPHLPAMTACLAGALEIDPGAIGIKGKTGEGIGEVGRGEAIAVHAVALLAACNSPYQRRS